MSGQAAAVAATAQLAGLLDALTEQGDWARATVVEREIAGLLPAALAACGSAGAAVDRPLAILHEVADVYQRAVARIAAARAEVQRERDRVRRGFRDAGAYLQVAGGR
jgi:hypothetical protein